MNGSTDNTRQLEELRLRLENFRPFRDSGEFRLGQLTCLVGSNSSGKSSIISTLLLLKQSIQQERVSSRVTPLMLSGPYCDLGSFRDVVYGHKIRSPIKFSFKIPATALWNPPEKRGPLVPLDVPRSVLQERGYYRQFVPASFDYKLERLTRGIITVSFSFVTDVPFGPSLSRLELNVEGIGSAYFLRTTSGERPQHWRVYTDDLPRQSFAMLVSQRRFFPQVGLRPNVFQKASPPIQVKLRRFLRASERAFEYLDRLVTSSEVIGPFRTPPERRYAFGGFSSNRGGPRGEQAIDLLITEELLKTKRHPLRSAVSVWLRHLNLAEDISVEGLTKNINLFQLNLGGVGKSARTNFADVGYGISQVLPVIVQGLLMPPGSTYLVQQPELHLHPDAQAGLADFFLYLACFGIRVVVETHSEYLLIRLRRRLAERKLNIGRRLPGLKRTTVRLSPASVAILLSSIDRRRTGARVTELTIGDSFQFENLPRDFMGQAIADRVALLKAAGSKR